MKKVFLLLFLLSFSAVFAKSFYIKSADVNVDVADNGLVSVTETLTFSFEGCYSVIYREIPLRSESYIINFTGASSESFYETRPSENGYFIYEFNFNDYQCDKDTTVVMKYSMGKVVDSYDDISSLHFQFWGADWEYVGELNAVITLPFNVLQYWIHNEVNANTFSNTSSAIIYHASGVPSGHWVELQAVFSPLESRDYADVHAGSYAEEIKALEAYYAIVEFFKNLFAVIFLAAPPILFFYVYNKYGRELIVDYMGVYERNPPTNTHPALVNAILKSPSSGNPDLSAFTATMFELARRKIISFKGDEKDVVIKIEKRGEALDDYESKVFNFLLSHSDSKDEIVWKSLKSKLASYDESERFQRVISAFNEAVKSKFKKEDYFNKKGNNVFLIISFVYLFFSVLAAAWLSPESLIILMPALFLVVPVVAVLSAVKQNPAGILVMIVLLTQFIPFFAGMLFLVNSFFSTAFIVSFIAMVSLNIINRKILGQWTREGRNFELKWNNFKKYLKDYSLLSEHPPQSIIIWEQFLVYAIALGVADNVIKVMKLSVPDFGRRSNMGILYYNPGFYSSMNSSFRTSSFTSRSGRSGGFGGGGGGFGGGHGGGGGGAR